MSAGALVSAWFREIDRRHTPMGEISLRRRLEPSLRVEVDEVRLDDEFLMSSLFTVAEVQLAELGLEAVLGTDLDVIVGGLGLGYTARAVLEDPRVRSLWVVEALGALIEWHQQAVLPLGATLRADARCHLVEGDFFALVADGPATAAPLPDHVDAILVDIDHSPTRLLHPSHARLYRPDGLRHLASRLHPGGTFALWSDDPPDATFVTTLGGVFPVVESHIVAFPNPYTGGDATNTVYVATHHGA